tara:strand:- start:49 stop:705 length:657 start_codon:yes stop_codon:yes gene_type:complete
VSKNITIDERLETYISDNSYNLHPIQKEIIEDNKKLGNLMIMQISVTQGYFLQLIIKLNNIKNVLEIGTFTGYSALTMALSLPKEGSLTSLDKNKKTSIIAKNYFKKAKLDHKINIMLNNALESMKNLLSKKNKFDLIFIDADKENYIKYYNLSYQLLNKNGLIVIDNVLWKGEVSKPDKNDRLTTIIREFNNFLKNDDRIEKTILPLGDGITICRKI